MFKLYNVQCPVMIKAGLTGRFHSSGLPGWGQVIMGYCILVLFIVATLHITSFLIPKGMEVILLQAK